jgi:two-component system, LuxR family, sensor kinase FixL
MNHNQTYRFWRSAAQCLLGGIAVALVTFVCFRLNVSITTAALLYLIVVVLASLAGSFVLSAVVSIIAILCLDYFFTEPLFNIDTTLRNPLNLVALITFLGTALVITSLMSKVRKSFQETQALKDQLRLVVDTIPALVWSILPDGSVVFLNQRWLDYTGLSLEEGLGQGWQAAIHPEDRARFVDEWASARAAGKPLEAETRLRRADGEHRWLLIRAVPLRDEKGNIVKWYGTSTEIEERKRAEEVLREQSRLLDLTHDTVFVRDVNDVITYWNRGAAKLYGWTREEAVGKVTHQLMQTIFPAPLEEINAELLRTGRWEGELVHTKRDGTQVTVASRWSIQQDEQGRPLATLETNNDITERKQAEEALRKAQSELAHVTRVMTMGELTASIAHEVNQPLSGVVTNSNACLRWLAAPIPNLDEARQAVSRIIRDGNRASDIITRIRALVRKTDTEKDRLDINDAIQDVAALAQGEVRRNCVVLRTELAHDLPSVVGDRVQLQQVILNLVMNGVEAMPSVADRRRELLICSRQHESDKVLVAVQDSGIGLDPQSMERIFDAFYTTKSEGMGMGLAISRSIVENHGGRLWAVSNNGPGATFQFTLLKHD